MESANVSGGHPGWLRKGVARALGAVLLVLSSTALAIALLPATDAAGAPLSWSITPSPNPSPPGYGNYLDGVSCVSSTFCVAVGTFSNGSTNQALVDTFDGTSWSITQSPNIEGSSYNVLEGVSCVSPTFCVAVGTLVETFDGTSWSVTQNSSGIGLEGVSCVSPTFCVAVGTFSNGSTNQALVETFDGTSWSITQSPNPSDNENSLLSAVSCVSPTFCVAVGHSVNFSVTHAQALVETFDGTSWSITPSPNGSGNLSGLFGVSCTSPNSCVAVGWSDGASLVETFDGISWSVVTSANAPGGGYLEGVSCSSSLSCVAIGYASGTLVETFDGTSWSIITSPNPPSNNGSRLFGVSCTYPASCVAVGDYYDSDNNEHTLVEAGHVPRMTRVFGQDAIGTAIAESQAQFPASGSADAVVLARSDFFADTLAGGPLAAQVGGPLLITPGASLTSSLDSRVLAEIKRVLPVGKTVYVLGGDLALSPDIDTTLEALGYGVVREAGADEYATAVDIAEQLGNPKTVFEATGLSFYDSLSAVPAAIESQGAILLTNGATQAPETAAYLASHSSDTRYAIGGPLAASGADPSATAIYGQDLYGTSAAVAAKFFPHPTTFGAATSASFTDALAAGPALGLASAPILLVPPSGPLPTAISQYLSSVGSGLSGGTLYGGPLAVGNDVLAELDVLMWSKSR